MNQHSDALSTSQQLGKAQFFGTIFALQIILLLAALDQTVISTAMPHIVMQLGGFDRYAWATTGYLLASTIAVPVLGKISDLYGRKIVLSIGVLIFIIASALCGAAGEFSSTWLDGMNQLILARTLQGIGGGAIVGLSFSVIGDLLPPATRGKYQGFFAAVFALASIIGPTIGGYVADIASWRYLFYVNIPIGIFGLIIFNACFPASKLELIDKKIDFPGIILFSICVTSLLLGLNFSGDSASNWQSLAWLSGALITFCFFAWVERRASEPFVPLFVFKNPIIVISAFSVAVTGVGMFGSTLLIPLFMQSVLGLSAAKSGLFLSPLIITVAVFSVVGGYWMSKSGKYRAVTLCGLAAMTIGVFFLSALKIDSSLPVILSFMLLVGVGLGLLLPIYTVVIQNAVSDEFLGTVTGLSQFSRSMGGTLGVAGFGALLLYFYQGNLFTEVAYISELPPPVMHLLMNPLAGNHLTEDIKSGLTKDGSGAVESVPTIALRTHGSETALARELANKSQLSLVNAIDSVFRLYAGMLLFAFCLNLLLKELPLRAHNKSVEVS